MRIKFQHSQAKRARVIDDFAARIFFRGYIPTLGSQSSVDGNTSNLEGTWTIICAFNLLLIFRSVPQFLK